MDNKLFEKLYESMTQMNEIIVSERTPSREFVVTDSLKDKIKILSPEQKNKINERANQLILKK